MCGMDVSTKRSKVIPSHYYHHRHPLQLQKGESLNAGKYQKEREINMNEWKKKRQQETNISSGQERESEKKAGE